MSEDEANATAEFEDDASPLDVRNILNTTETVDAQKADEDIEFDMGNLTTYDLHPLATKQIKSNKEDYLKTTGTENVQRFVARLLSLDKKRFDDASTPSAFVLPVPTTRLPREKQLPATKPLTKWEKFAQEKGIGKHKRDRMMYDEEAQDWRPRFGYKRAGGDQKDWLIEEKPGENLKGAEDPFEARKANQKAKIESQKLRQVQNEKRAAYAAEKKSQLSKLPATVALTNTSSKPGLRSFRDKKQLVSTMATTSVSTASLGRFDTHRPEEPKKQAHRTKRDAVASEEGITREKTRSIALLNKMFGASAKPELNVQKAVKIATLDEEKKNRQMRKGAPGKGKKRRVQDASKDKTFTQHNPRPAKRQRK